jgi:hypothetical protein
MTLCALQSNHRLSKFLIDTELFSRSGRAIIGWSDILAKVVWFAALKMHSDTIKIIYGA